MEIMNPIGYRRVQNNEQEDRGSNNGFDRQGDSSNLDEQTGLNSQRSRSKRDVADATSGELISHSVLKRSVPNLFSILKHPNSNDWLAEDSDMSGFHYGDEPADEVFPSDTLQEIQKRTFPRSFLRYGREPTDLHFIRCCAAMSNYFLTFDS